jgi:hypothetical protein
MEEQKSVIPLPTLRPHHALCVLFFEGKGYSQAFIENMTTFMADPNRMLYLTMECDTLCQACPHNQNGFCEDEAKVTLFDQRALSQTGSLIDSDQPILLSSLCQGVYDAILQEDLLAKVCGECEWAELCQEKWQHGEFNRQLLQSDLTGSRPC